MKYAYITNTNYKYIPLEVKSIYLLPKIGTGFED